MATTAQELEKMVVRLTGDGSAYKKTLDDAVNATKKAATEINGTVRKIASSTSEMMTKVGSSLTSMGMSITTYVTLPMAAAAVACLKLSGDMEQTRMQFATMLGADKGANLLDKLKKFSDITPFHFDKVAEAGQSLLAFGVQADDVMGDMKILGDVAAGAKRPIEDVARVFGKVTAAGKLNGEEMRQLIDMNIGYKDVAESMGKTVPQFIKLMEEGAVPAEALTETMKRLTRGTGRFADAAAKQGQTLLGKLSTFVDKIEDLARKIGDQLSPVAQRAMAYLGPLVDKFTEWAGTLDNVVGPAVEYMAGIITGLIDAFLDLDPQIKMLIGIMPLVAAVLGPVILAVGLLATGMGEVMVVTTLYIAAFLTIAATMLAVTDTLGLTKTGFGDLFNSIRIGGTGLATWMGAIFNYIHRDFINLTTGLEYIWLMVWTTIKRVFYAFADGYLEKIQQMAEALVELNNLLPKKLQMDLSGVDAFGKSIAHDRAARDAEVAGGYKEADNVLLRGERAKAALDHKTGELFKNDPQDNTTGVAFNKDKAMKGLSEIGDTATQLAKDALNGIKNMLPQAHGKAAAEAAKDANKPKQEADKLIRPVATTKKDQTNFQQVALNRMSIAGLTGFKTKAQEVTDVQNGKKLDKIVAAMEKGQNHPIVPATVLTQ